MKTINALIFLVIISMISIIFFIIGTVGKNDEIKRLKKEIDKGVISNHRLIPQTRLVTDGKIVDTLYIYKNK